MIMYDKIVYDAEDFIYIDVRNQDEYLYKFKNSKRGPRKMQAVKPLIQTDMQHLPFKDDIFNMIIFDPPHLDLSPTSYMREKYGSWSLDDSIRIVKKANEEFKRVLKKGGVFILKCLLSQRRRYEVLLSNFIFFLPIIYRSKSYRSGSKTLWNIGQLKKRV